MRDDDIDLTKIDPDSIRFREGIVAGPMTNLPIDTLLDEALALTMLFNLMGYAQHIPYLGPVPGIDLCVGVIVTDGNIKHLHALGRASDLDDKSVEEINAIVRPAWAAKIERYNSLSQDQRVAFFEQSRVCAKAVEIIAAMTVNGLPPRPNAAISAGVVGYGQTPPPDGAKA